MKAEPAVVKLCWVRLEMRTTSAVRRILTRPIAEKTRFLHASAVLTEDPVVLRALLGAPGAQAIAGTDDDGEVLSSEALRQRQFFRQLPDQEF